MLKRIIYLLVQGARKHPNLRTFMLHDVYRLNHIPNVVYGALVVETLQAQEIENLVRFRFRIYYVDRLTANKDNMLDVQSTGIDVLHDILFNLEEELDLSAGAVYRVFDQKFKDECAGAYVEVSLDIPAPYYCVEEEGLGDFNLDFNEDFLLYLEENNEGN